jgi:hypothetical protein
MAGPAVVVAAGVATAVIAIRSNDGVVADDYYRQGLAINRALERERRAKDLAVAATLQVNEDAKRARVVLAAHARAPAMLRLWLIHPTRAGEDQLVALSPVGPGIFEGPIGPVRAGRWGVRLEDDAGTWRLEGEWRTGMGRVTLGDVDG